MRILIIANARMRGGISGGDAIYESFKKYWPNCSFHTWTMLDIDYSPFAVCYCHRIFVACIIAIFERRRFDCVYSASDFLPDSIPAFLYKITHKKSKWVAGLFLKAFPENKFHYFSQKLVKWLIDKFADMVIVTNPTMFDMFPGKKKTWINGGVDMSLAGLSNEPKVYDAVFCGRIHPSKGIDELIEIWKIVIGHIPYARLAIIGDGDLGKEYLIERMPGDSHVSFFGYMGDERYKVYKKSKVVLYPTPRKYDHFSMSPVEAMACGCPMICFDNPVMRKIGLIGTFYCNSVESFAKRILDFSNGVSNFIKFQCLYSGEEFDYKKQSLRVYNEIRKELYENPDNRCLGDAGVSPTDGT